VVTLPPGLRISTEVVRSDSGTVLPVTRIDPHPNPKRVFLVAMGYAASLDPFEIQRFGLIAHRLRARLLIPETPGCSYHARTRLTMHERLSIFRSDFHPTAERMLRAALSLDSARNDSRSYGVLGYSMGASIASAMADSIHNDRTDQMSLSSVILVEPVANQRWGALNILRSIRAEDRLIDHYLKHNDAIEGAVNPSDRIDGAPQARERQLDMLLLANALRAGRLINDLHSAAQQSYTLVVAHGRDSTMSRMDAAARLLQECRDFGITAIDLEVDGRHGLWQSLPAVDDLTVRIADAIGVRA